MGPAPPPGPPSVAQGPADGGMNPERRKNSGIGDSWSDSWTAQKEPTIRQLTIRNTINTFFIFSPYNINNGHHKNVVVQTARNLDVLLASFPVGTKLPFDHFFLSFQNNQRRISSVVVDKSSSGGFPRLKAHD